MQSTTEKVLLRIALAGMEKAKREDFIHVACAFWHEGYVPNLSKFRMLSKEEKRVVGYLTEYFTGFSVLNRRQSLALLKVSDKIKVEVKPECNEFSRIDPVAKEWGLTAGMDRHLSDLLLYRTPPQTVDHLTAVS